MLRTLKNVTRSARYRAASFLGGGARSFSAYGEDLLVMAWLQKVVDLRKIRYLDIGAAHPINLSNTFSLYSLGASGILVEPDPDQAALLRKMRPRDTVINAGISFDGAKRAILTRYDVPAFNTYSEHAVHLLGDATWTPKPKIVDCIETPMRSINEFAREIDFLSIDTEWTNFEVLSSWDFARSLPLAICVEASAPPTSFLELLEPHGYSLIAKTPDNLIFLRLPSEFSRQ